MLANRNLGNDAQLRWVNDQHLPAGPVGDVELMAAGTDEHVVRPAANQHFLDRLVFEIDRRQLAGVDPQE